MSNPIGATVASACPKACSSCPWRLANQGSKPDPHGFYTKSNLSRLWKGIRDGARMSCHPTDPRMAEFEGYESLAEREVTHECAGSLTLVLREAHHFQEIALEHSKKVLPIYRKKYPNGLTRYGLLAVANRQIFGGTMLDKVKMVTPDLNDAEVGYPPLDKRGS